MGLGKYFYKTRTLVLSTADPEGLAGVISTGFSEIFDRSFSQPVPGTDSGRLEIYTDRLRRRVVVRAHENPKSVQLDVRSFWRSLCNRTIDEAQSIYVNYNGASK